MLNWPGSWRRRCLKTSWCWIFDAMATVGRPTAVLELIRACHQCLLQVIVIGSLDAAPQRNERPRRAKSAQFRHLPANKPP